MNGMPSVVQVNDAPERMARDPIGLLVQVSAAGDIVLIDSGSSLAPTTYVFNHPDAVREIQVTKHASFRKGGGMKALEQVLGEDLITNDGPTHRTRPRLVQPVFHRARIAPFGEIITSYGLPFSDVLEPNAAVDQLTAARILVD